MTVPVHDDHAGPPGPGASFHLICIIGSGHSGSTILARLLGAVPGAIAVGELRRVWSVRRATRRCACGALLRECPFWGAVLEATGAAVSAPPLRFAREQRVLFRWYAAPFLRLGLHPRFLKAPLEQFAVSRRALLASVVTVSGARLVVDSSKSASYPLALAAAGFDVTTVHLTRDARAVVHSALQRSRRSGWRSSLAVARRIGRRWVSRCLGADLLWLGSRQKVRLRYEDLCAEPARALNAILARAGVEAALPPDQRTFDLPAEHIFQGNQSRRGSGPTTVELDERWRAGMPAPARWATIAVTWPLLVWYGYLPRR